jgi:hypothetical protein
VGLGSGQEIYAGAVPTSRLMYFGTGQGPLPDTQMLITTWPCATRAVTFLVHSLMIRRVVLWEYANRIDD